jgi:hypothetical protein
VQRGESIESTKGRGQREEEHRELELHERVDDKGIKLELMIIHFDSKQ